MALTKINLGNMVTGTLPDANIPNDITIDVSSAVPASGLTGSTLASGVTASSLTSVGTLTSLTTSGEVMINNTSSGNAQLYIKGAGTGTANGLYITDSAGADILYVKDNKSAKFYGTLETVGSATFGGTVSFPDGSASTPSITNTGDTDTGFYFGADNEINMTIGGTQIWRWSGQQLGAQLGANPGYPAYSFGTDWNTGMYLEGADILAFSTGGVKRLTLNSSNIETSTGSAISYDTNASVSSPTATYLLARHDTEYSVADSNANYKRMKTILVAKSGKLRIKWAGYIASGSYYWSWMISRNNGSTTDMSDPGTMLLTNGNNATGTRGDGLAQGETSATHSYRTFDVSIKDVEAGDQIELWMRSSADNGGVVTGNGQNLYAKEFMIYSTTPTVEQHSMRNNIKQIVERNTNTGFNSSSSSYVYTGMYATITPKSKGSVNQIWVSFPFWQSDTVAYSYIKLVADYADGSSTETVYEQKDHYQGETTGMSWNVAFQVQHDHNKTTGITYKIYIDPNGTSIWAPNDHDNNNANKGMITIWEVETE